MDTRALAAFIGAGHTLDEAVSDMIWARIKTLTKMAVHLEGHANRRAAAGAVDGREREELRALKWALRLCTLPDVQAEAYAQLFEAGQTEMRE